MSSWASFTRSRTSAGSFRSRSAFATVDRSFPTRCAIASWVSPWSSMRTSYASASSIAFRSSRWRFSTSASSKASRSLASRSTAGISFSPARCAARQRRSPARIRYLPPSRRTRIGSTIPCSRMEAASSSSRFSSNRFRGCFGFRSTASSGSERSIRPDAAPAAAEVGGAAFARRAAIPRPRAGLRFSAIVTRRLLALRAASSPRGRARGSSGTPSRSRRRGGWACRGTAPRRAARSAGSPS